MGNSKVLQLSSIGFMNCRCLIKRYGSKASSYKGTQFSQLYKIVEKIVYRAYEEDTFSYLVPFFCIGYSRDISDIPLTEDGDFGGLQSYCDKVYSRGTFNQTWILKYS